MMNVKYSVRTRQLLDIVNEIKSNRIILSPYFQRNFVWREIHRIDFIKTIMMGLPFPEIFVAKGDLDVVAMVTTSFIVDGQQRLNSIIGFIEGNLEVDGKKWATLSNEEKEAFLKYEMAVIELDIRHDDPQVLEIFKRLNRTYYSLSNIEKMSSEYGPTEIMLIAKLLIGDIVREVEEDDDNDESDPTTIYKPNFPIQFLEWSKNQNIEEIKSLLIDSPIFTGYEKSRQVPLMLALNILGTIKMGIFARNISKDALIRYSEEYPDKDSVMIKLNNVAKLIMSMDLDTKSYWYNKANAFTLITSLYEKIENLDISVEELKERLESFEQNIPADYALAAKEGVNNKQERLLRNEYMMKIINGDNF
ncbi:DUF262 domain-containing protein [Paenibacillus sp. M2]|uniref:DUF262 domain-containing protein n=1 Tax=Paenibacillus sp. M2 TaxID=3341793 RepID=UPI0039894CB0